MPNARKQRTSSEVGWLRSSPEHLASGQEVVGSSPAPANPAFSERPEIPLLLAHLAGQSDFGAVLIGAACAEESLTRLLQAALFESPARYDNLFDPERPCSSFAAKIALAARMSVVSDQCYRALDALRRFRNRFAHSTGTVGADEPILHELLSELYNQCSNHPDYRAYESLLSKASMQPWRVGFSAACITLISALDYSRNTIRPFNFYGRGQATLT